MCTSKKKHQVIIVPNSEHEDNFEDMNWEESLAHHNETGEGDLHTFNTEDELGCFLQGYHAGIGYLGTGHAIIK